MNNITNLSPGGSVLSEKVKAGVKDRMEMASGSRAGRPSPARVL